MTPKKTALVKGPILRCAVITLFPEMFQAITEYGITGRAIQQGLWQLYCINPRQFSEDDKGRIDDRPYGGGPGMVMQPQPLKSALLEARKRLQNINAPLIYLSPQGEPLNQERLRGLATHAIDVVPKQKKSLTLSQEEPHITTNDIILLCGRYEGVDERFIQKYVDYELSLGDFVLSGGEIPALALLDGMVRLLPGACGHECSVVEDSFTTALLDHAHYTRPDVFESEKVPSVLLSGHHEAIAQWRLENAYERTRAKRPDLLADTSEHLLISKPSSKSTHLPE